MNIKQINEELKKFLTIKEEVQKIDELIEEQFQKLKQKYPQYTFNSNKKEYYGGHDTIIDINVPIEEDMCTIHLIFENIKQRLSNEYNYSYTFHYEVELTAEDESFRKELQNIFNLKNRNGIMKGYLYKMAGMKRIHKSNGFQVAPTIYTERTHPIIENISMVFGKIDEKLSLFLNLVQSMDTNLKHKRVYKKSETPRQKSQYITLFYEKSQWGLDIQLKVMTRGYQVVSHVGGWEYGEYNPNQQTDSMSGVCKDWKQAINQAVQQCLDEDDLVEDLLYAGDCFGDNEYAQYFKSKLEDVNENEDEE